MDLKQETVDPAEAEQSGRRSLRSGLGDNKKTMIKLKPGDKPEPEIG